MYCQTCKKESYALHGSGKIGKPALCSVCGNRFDKVYRDIFKQLYFIESDKLTFTEKNILKILQDAGVTAI